MNRRKIKLTPVRFRRLHIRRNHKDALFVRLFGSKEKLLSLYNALNHSHYTNPKDLEINTLDDFIYMSIKNDVSFIIGSYLNLYEHQSTFCPNMPIRGLMYFAGVYKAYIEMNDLNINGTKQIYFPTPQYTIFYNGTKDYGDVKKLRLSDAFQQENGCLEVVATMYNINAGHNRELMEQCKTLEEYASFIAKIRDFENLGMTIDIAVDKACEECISQGILKSFLLKNRSEVMQMFRADYDPKRQRWLDRRDAYNDGKNDGRAEGRAEGKAEALLDLLSEFGSVPDELEKRIRDEKDPEVLRSMLKRAAKAKSIEEFLEKTEKY